MTSSSPQRAKDIANAVVGATAEVASLIESGGDADAGVVRLVPVTNAELPGAPSSPNVERILLIGLAAGLVLAYAVVMLRLRLDTRIRHPQDVTGHDRARAHRHHPALARPAARGCTPRTSCAAPSASP